MVVRCSWLDSLIASEDSAGQAILGLDKIVRQAPRNLEALSSTLGARIVKVQRPKPCNRWGQLRRTDTGWQIEIAAENRSLTGEQRFTVAHELAHLLLLRRGVPQPSSESEYWILEEACDRLALLLLVPNRCGPHGNLSVSAVRQWFKALRSSWRLPTPMAAELIWRRSTNCEAAAVVDVVNRGRNLSPRFALRWSSKSSDSWPESGSDGCIDAATNPIFVEAIERIRFDCPDLTEGPSGIGAIVGWMPSKARIVCFAMQHYDVGDLERAHQARLF